MFSIAFISGPTRAFWSFSSKSFQMTPPFSVYIFVTSVWLMPHLSPSMNEDRFATVGASPFGAALPPPFVSPDGEPRMSPPPPPELDDELDDELEEPAVEEPDELEPSPSTTGSGMFACFGSPFGPQPIARASIDTMQDARMETARFMRRTVTPSPTPRQRLAPLVRKDPMLEGVKTTRRASFAMLFAAVGLLAGCGSGKDPNAPSRPLPTYAGRAAELFDDAIEPAAVGLDFDKSYLPKSDALLRERTQLGDAVLRVRVSTVTAKNDGPTATYQIGLQTIEKLTGEHPPTPTFTVQIDKSSESHGIMKNFESRLVGYFFVAFVREFVRSDGDRDIHFHLAPDTKEVRAAVTDAMAVSGLKEK